MVNPRVSRKSLKEPDEFISFTSKMLKLAVAQKTKLIISGGVLLGVLFFISIIHYWSEKTENNGSLALSHTMEKFAAAEKVSGPEKAYEAMSTDFQKILDEYSNYACGRYARLIFAGVCFQSGKFEKAAALYSQTAEDLKETPLIRNIALKGLGHTYEAQKEYAKAATLFERLSAEPNSIMEDENLFTLARLYGRLNKNDKKAEALKQILDKYPESIYKIIAKEVSAG
jgi:tetratricopeptide (TPR) repeat protein